MFTLNRLKQLIFDVITDDAFFRAVDSPEHPCDELLESLNDPLNLMCPHYSDDIVSPDL